MKDSPENAHYDIIKVYENLAEALENFEEEKAQKAARAAYAFADRFGLKELQDKLKDVVAPLQNSRGPLKNKLFHALLEAKSILYGYLHKKYRILISTAEVPEILVKAEKMLIKDFGFYCVGENFLEAAWALIPDAIILVNKEKADEALLLYKKLKEEGAFANIPVIFLGERKNDLALKAVALGALDYISLDTDTREFAFKLKNMAVLGQELKKSTARGVATSASLANYAFRLANLKLQECKKNGRRFSLLFLDIDGLSRVNITRGRFQGDSLLKLLALAIDKHKGEECLSFRCGGDEFILVFPEAEPGAVYQSAERIKEDFKGAAKKYGLFLSLSGAIISADANYITAADINFKDMVSLAKKEAAKIKGEGGDRISFYSLEGEERVNIKIPVKILVVDNDPLLQNILKDRYTQKGYDVYIAGSGEEALELFREIMPAVVITEYLLPGMDGDRLTAAIKKIDKNARVLFLSAQKLDNIIERAMLAGADDYLTKPFLPLELDFKIARILKEQGLIKA